MHTSAAQADEPLRVLTLGGPTLFWDGVRCIIDIEPDLSVIHDVPEPRTPDAVVLTSLHRPHVVLVDRELAGQTTLDVVGALRTHAPESGIIVLSGQDDTRMVSELLALGVRAYLSKTVTSDELLATIRSVSRGEGRVHLILSAERRPAVPGGEFPRERGGSPGAPHAVRLSQREHDVLSLAAEALSNSQIARRLYISEGTVKRHMRHVFNKLNAVSRIDAVNKAISAALIPAPRVKGDRSQLPDELAHPHQ
ncbi:LuxR C-terminal-related transcriptional regulator [Salinispora arenicola]|uniref:LuxR C-terminal-related transcriptional regulator n=1 Tax=Salinispora arenicola TaxID=168697 RepID=UPI0006ACACE8|nr:response regulator transcription factor [Salinispora arenicola]